MKQFTSELSFDELETIILERVIEDVGLIIGTEHKTFKNILTVAQELKEFPVETFVDYAIDEALIYDGQLDRPQELRVKSIVRLKDGEDSLIGIIENINLYREPSMRYAVDIPEYVDLAFTGTESIIEVLVW